jgi:hypothetical protein
VQDNNQATMKPGKGTSAPMKLSTLRTMAERFHEAAELFEAAESPEEFMRTLNWPQQNNTEYDRGDRHYAAFNKWFAVQTAAGEELRVQASLNDQGQFTLTFRGWWGG